ncbi:MAG: NUDIX hydrolase [Planctomycetota bacterium]
MTDPPAFEIVARRTLHRGTKFDFEQIDVALDGGGTLSRDLVRHPGAVVVLPLVQTPQGPRVVYLKNQRPAIGEALIELPAGTLEPPEPPDVCAHRELIEEAGYNAATITPLSRFYTTPGMTDELMHAFVATDLRAADRAPEAGERMTVHLAPPSELLAMVEGGGVMDAKSMLTLLLAERRGLLAGDAD